MAVASLKEILDRAFAERYGVAAFNVVNDLTLEAVVAAAEEVRSPLIVQTSVKTVKSIGAKLLYDMFRAVAEPASVPVTLHLDHCPDREVLTTCLETGWNSVLFDGLGPAGGREHPTVEVVAEARRHGAHVEGEIEGVRGSRTTSAPTRRARSTRSRRRSPSSRPPSTARRVSARPTASTTPSPSSTPSA